MCIRDRQWTAAILLRFIYLFFFVDCLVAIRSKLKVFRITDLHVEDQGGGFYGAEYIMNKSCCRWYCLFSVSYTHLNRGLLSKHMDTYAKFYKYRIMLS